MKFFRSADIFLEPVEVPLHFDGVTRITHLPSTIDGPDKLATVVHHNGAQTAWHRHPGGQVIVVLGGRARIVVDGQEPVALGVGDLVVADPNERHRHGAAEGHECAFVVYFGGQTIWEDD